MSVDFSHLTSSAAFDILSYEDFHSGPPVVGCDELEGFWKFRHVQWFCGREKGMLLPF